MEEDMCTEKYGAEFTEAVNSIKSDDDGNIDPPPLSPDHNLTLS